MMIIQIANKASCCIIENISMKKSVSTEYKVKVFRNPIAPIALENIDNTVIIEYISHFILKNPSHKLICARNIQGG